MISLAFLPLQKFSVEHYNELEASTLIRFNLIHNYFKTLNSLTGKKRHPKAAITTAVSVFSKKSTRKLLEPNKTQFNTPALYTDCLNILKELEKQFDVTLNGTPAETGKLVNQVKKILYKHIKKNQLKFEYLSYFKHFTEALKFVWDYDGFIDKQSEVTRYNAYRLAKKLGVSCCPYCNRTYTITVSEAVVKGKKILQDEIARPEFDHFYSKGRYPFLATSFYNLVPSCSLCNSTLKGEKEMTIVTHCHPYIEGYEQIFSFTTGVTVKAFLQQRHPSVPIDFKPDARADPNHLKRAEATHSLFCIKKIYPYHSDIAEDLFRRSTEDSKKLILSYWNQVSPNGNYLFKTKDDLYRHFIGNFYSTRDFYKRPLAKFYYDILKETKIIGYIRSLPSRPILSAAVPLIKV